MNELRLFRIDDFSGKGTISLMEENPLIEGKNNKDALNKYLHKIGLKVKVKDLIQDYLGSDFVVREVKFLLDKIEVNLYNIDLGDTEYKYYDLVSFEVD